MSPGEENAKPGVGEKQQDQKTRWRAGWRADEEQLRMVVQGQNHKLGERGNTEWASS